MNKQLRIAALTLATIVVVILAVQPLLPVVQERFSELGILGPNMTVGNYPSTVLVNQSFLLYGIVANHQGIVQDYLLFAKLGNQSTIIDNSTASNAPIVSTYWQIVDNGGTWLFPMSLFIDHPGTNLRIIFELWAYNTTRSSFAYVGLWNQVWLNATLA